MKKTSINKIIVMTVILSFYLSLVIQNTKANFFPIPSPDLPRILIKNDGSIEPITAPIQRTGNLYKLTDNIVLFSVEIQRDNIILDGAGYTIQGNASGLPGYDEDGNVGVILMSRMNVNITRLKFEQSDTAIMIQSSTNVNVVNNSFCNNLNRGITIQDSTHVLIEDNIFLDIYGGDPSIILIGSKNIIRNNMLTGSIRGIEIRGQSNMIVDNRIESLLPIIIDRADNNIIARNNITGPASSPSLPDQNYKGNEGIALFSRCSNNLIYGNNITGFTGQAIRTVFSCSNNVVYGNYFADNEFAIALQSGATNNTFYGNTFMTDSCKIHIGDEVEDIFWDNGTIGNYWGNYNGTDSDGDGVGDSPYIINALIWDTDVDGFVSYVSGQDNYPLIAPYNFEFDKIVIPSSLPFAALLVLIPIIGVGILVYFKTFRK